MKFKFLRSLGLLESVRMGRGIGVRMPRWGNGSVRIQRWKSLFRIVRGKMGLVRVSVGKIFRTTPGRPF